MYDLSDARVIRLEPGKEVHEVATFEEAFGEHSEFRLFDPKRRAARIKRRQEGRTEITKARAEGRAARRQARIAGRGQTQLARVNKRQMLKKARNPEDDTTVDDTAQSPADDTSSDTSAPAPAPDNVADTSGSDDSGSDDSGSDDSGSDDSGSDDSFTGESSCNGGEYFDGIGQTESSFDGNEISLEPNDHFAYIGVDGVQYNGVIHPEVRRAARNIELHKEQVSRFESMYNNNPSPEIADKIAHHKEQAMEWESRMEGYADFDGQEDTSGFLNRRNNEAKAAVREARKERMKARLVRAKANKNIAEKLEGGIPAEVSNGGNKVTIPAEENASFSGLGADGEQTESFAGLTDAKSYVSKNKKTIIATGVALAIVGGLIWANQKYKWI